ncbi:RNA recognition motif domain containing protein [Brugia malayi]|uniref:Bm11036 n=1 Tax=Brugia malayi TaxID=6279 RepID=A0A0J9Y823_BRUMA|nr:RNA recognition motif domain containing protein [Brugia malayi]CDQ04003.1 Bm11036 [Brugia malayi]VIO99324.1 RNA recognition motif domain containing protein [Brugia malayi]
MSGRRGSYRDDEIPTLYVRQVHYSARPDDLRALFEQMGPVRDVYIPLDYYTRESRGFAYVKFEFTRDAEDALRELNGTSILGRRIEVEWAEGQRKTKTEMRARDSYNSYRVRNRYRSRSPYKSGHDRSPRRRSRSRRHSHSRSKRRSHNSRRHRSELRRHHSSARSRNSRSTRSSSSSVRKNRSKGREIQGSKSPPIPGSLSRSLDGIKNPSDEEQDIVMNEHSISNRQIAEELREPIIDELEIRSEARASDVEIDEKQIQKSIQKNGSTVYLEDHVGVEIDGSNTSATEEEEEDKAVTDIEVIDEIVEQNGIIFNDTVVESDCLNNINVQELLIADTTT